MKKSTIEYNVITYSELVNEVEKNNIENYAMAVGYVLGRCGAITPETMDYINKLLADGFIKYF